MCLDHYCELYYVCIVAYVFLLAILTAARSVIGYWHDTVVSSVCTSGQLIHLAAKVSEQVNRKCPLEARQYNFLHRP